MFNVVSSDLLTYIHIFANRSIGIQTQQKSLLPYLGVGVQIYTNTTPTKITLGNIRPPPSPGCVTESEAGNAQTRDIDPMLGQ